MMKYSSFRFFLLQLRLFLQLCATVIEGVIAPAVNTVTVSLFLLGSLLFFSSIYFLFQHQFQTTMIAFYQQEVTNYQDQAQKEIVFWEEIAPRTPSRDVFLNLSQLYAYIGNQEKSDHFRSMAIQLDPNFFQP